MSETDELVLSAMLGNLKKIFVFLDQNFGYDQPKIKRCVNETTTQTETCDKFVCPKCLKNEISYVFECGHVTCSQCFDDVSKEPPFECCQCHTVTTMPKQIEFPVK